MISHFPQFPVKIYQDFNFLLSGMKLAKDALADKDKFGVGKYFPSNMDVKNQNTDTVDGNSGSKGSKGFFSGHTHQFRSGQGSVKKFKDQDFKELKRKSKNSGVLFEDSQFPASNHLLVDDNNQFIISYFGRSRFDQNSIQWLRPHVSTQIK